jgi:hypothetical protein
MAALTRRLTHRLPGGARIWRDVGAFLAGGSMTGFLAAHAAHATAVGGSTIVQVICSIAR